MNFLKIISMGVVAGSLGGFIATQTFLEPSEKSAASTSVQLVSDGGGFCSGTLIKDPTDKNLKTILTAKHCIEDLGQIVTVPYLGLKYKFKVNYISDKSDLALLQTEESFKSPEADIAPFAKFREKSLAVGYPLGYSQTVTQGFVGEIDIVEAFSAVSESRAFLRSTTEIAPGSSGGGLYQIFNGEYKIVGVATGVHSRYFFVTYWTPTEEIHSFLESLNG